MPEAVIVATGRTPIGRANKGSLVECRPDDLSALGAPGRARQGAPARPRRGGGRHPRLRAAGRRGRATTSPRVAAILAGLDNVPGVTVNRYCSSSLQTIRMAAHAIRAGEGDVFIAAGVETVSRYLHGASDTGPHNTDVRRGRGADQGPHARRSPSRGARRRACPTSTSPWARRPRTWPSTRRSAREEMDEFALLSQTRAVASQENGFFEREIIPVTLRRRHRRHQGRRARGPSTTLEGLANLKPVFREGGTVTAGNACPLNDGAAAVIVMSDTKAKELGITPAGPHRGQRRDRAQPRDHGARPGRGLPPGAGPGQHDASTTSTWWRSTRPSPPR